MTICEEYVSLRKIAKMLGENYSTIRYYKNEFNIYMDARIFGRRLKYSTQSVDLLVEILELKDDGFSNEEIESMLQEKKGVNGQTDRRTDGPTDKRINGPTDKRIDGPTDGRMDGLMDGRTVGWTDGWMNGWTDGPTDGLMDGQTDGLMDGLMDGQVDGQTDGQVDGQTDGQTDGLMDGQADGQVDEWTEGQVDEKVLNGIYQRVYERIKEVFAKDLAKELGGARLNKHLKKLTENINTSLTVQQKNQQVLQQAIEVVNKRVVSMEAELGLEPGEELSIDSIEVGTIKIDTEGLELLDPDPDPDPDPDVLTITDNGLEPVLQSIHDGIVDKTVLVTWLIAVRSQKPRPSYAVLATQLDNAGVPTLTGRAGWNSSTLSKIVSDSSPTVKPENKPENNPEN